MHYAVEASLPDRVRLMEAAHRAGEELGGTYYSDYIDILRDRGEHGPSETIDVQWETFSNLNSFDDDELAEELFRSEFWKGWRYEAKFTEENRYERGER